MAIANPLESMWDDVIKIESTPRLGVMWTIGNIATVKQVYIGVPQSVILTSDNFRGCRSCHAGSCDE